MTALTQKVRLRVSKRSERMKLADTDLLRFLFDGVAYVGIHKNAAGRITLVVNDGNGSRRTSCSKKGMSYTDKLIECSNRLNERKAAE